MGSTHVWLLLSFLPVSFCTTKGQAIEMPRIIGGSDAPAGSYPYMASLVDYSGTLGGGGGVDGHRCGGTLVAPDVVMTTAHCVNFVDGIQLGRYNIQVEESSIEHFVVRDTRVHPRYVVEASDKSQDVHADLALIKLYGASSFSPVLLNENDDIPSATNEQLDAVGWGLTTFFEDGLEGLASTMQHVTLDYIPNSECELKGEGANGNFIDYALSPDVICAVDFENGEDTCSGDSGGPLLISGSDVQVGLTSAGIDGCASQVFPGLYTRLSSRRYWINEALCELSDDPPDYLGCPDVPRSPEPHTSDVTITIQIETDTRTFDLGWIVHATNSYGVDHIYASAPIGNYTESTRSILNATISVPNDRAYNFTLLDRRGDGIIFGLGAARIFPGTELENTAVRYLDVELTPAFYSVTFPFTIGEPLPLTPSTMQPSPSPILSSQYLSIELVFDQFSEETGWILETLIDGETQLVDERYPNTYIGNNFTSGSAFQEKVNLPGFERPVRFRFTMTDNEGDGMCCEFGKGLARLYLGDKLLAEFSEFEYEAEFEFTTSAAPPLSVVKSLILSTALLLLLGMRR